MPSKRKGDRQFRVAHAFSAKDKDGKKRWITRENQHLVTEYFTTAQLDEFVAAGSLYESAAREAGEMPPTGVGPNTHEVLAQQEQESSEE